MNIAKENESRKDFCDILFELAKDQELLQDAHKRYEMYMRLEALYCCSESKEAFRHFYSDIFFVLTQLQQNAELGNMDTLGQNLLYIRTNYQTKNKDSKNNPIDISDSLRKLYDHVSLDIARLNRSDAGDRAASGEVALEELQTQINVAKEEINNAKCELEHIKSSQKTVEDKIDNQQKEYIAILGIFSAVVLTFTGGIAFSSSVLNNISQSSIYRTLIITLLIGMVLVNVFFVLFFYVEKLLNKKTELKPFVISNAILLTMIILVIISWLIGLVERRNDIIISMVTVLYIL